MRWCARPWSSTRSCWRAAVLWRVGFQRESLLVASAADGVHWLRDPLLGLVAGLLVIAVSAELTARTRLGQALARALADVIGPTPHPRLSRSRVVERDRGGGALPRRAPTPGGARLGKPPVRARAPGASARAAALVAVLARRGLPARRTLRRDRKPGGAGRRARRRERGEPAPPQSRLRRDRRLPRGARGRCVRPERPRRRAPLSFASASAGACGLFWPNAPPPLLAITFGRTSAAEDGKPSAGGGLGRNNPQAVTQLALRSRRSPPAEDVSAESTARAPRSHEPEQARRSAHRPQAEPLSS